MNYQPMYDPMEASRMRQQANTNLASSISGGISGIFQGIGQWQQFKKKHKSDAETNQHFAEGTKESLKDIGLSDDEINSVFGSVNSNSTPEEYAHNVALLTGPKIKRQAVLGNKIAAEILSGGGDGSGAAQPQPQQPQQPQAAVAATPPQPPSMAFAPTAAPADTFALSSPEAARASKMAGSAQPTTGLTPGLMPGDEPTSVPMSPPSEDPMAQPQLQQAPVAKKASIIEDPIAKHIMEATLAKQAYGTIDPTEAAKTFTELSKHQMDVTQKKEDREQALNDKISAEIVAAIGKRQPVYKDGVLDESPDLASIYSNPRAYSLSAPPVTNKQGSIGIAAYLLNDEENKALSRALNNGLDPHWINSRTAKVFAQLEMESPNMPWNTMSANAVFERAMGTQTTQALLNNIEPILNKLLVAGKALGNTSIPFLNAGVNFIKEHTGDPTIVAFNNLRDDAIAEVERGLVGTSVLSDSKYMRALQNVNSAQNYPQLEAAVNNMGIVIQARLAALKEQSQSKRPYTDKPGGAIPLAPVPKVGDVINHPNGVTITRTK